MLLAPPHTSACPVAQLPVPVPVPKHEVRSRHAPIRGPIPAQNPNALHYRTRLPKKRKTISLLHNFNLPRAYGGSSTAIPEVYRVSLNLLGAPSCVGIAHIRRRLDRRDILEDNIGNADNAYNSTGEEAPPPGSNSYGTDENVNYRLVSNCASIANQTGLQMPRPRNENMKEAYRATC